MLLIKQIIALYIGFANWVGFIKQFIFCYKNFVYLGLLELSIQVDSLLRHF